ncbi:tetratricopeptide repeat protein [Pleomorphochaeta sp. DL1XJH-081]|uniref:tetratricopeptide repeat protein n=1 Tax=Pleomorphochaeta sp. DL1XJH-081 TaxID=3409690 RepID=UPI003BB6ED5B
MKNPTLLAFLVAIIGIMILPVAQSVRLLLIILIFAGFIYWKRGYILVALGSRALSAKQPDAEKAWRLYLKAWKAGLPANYTIMLGNLFVQRGDKEIALQIYDSVLEKERGKRQPDGEIIISARIARTMALWVLDRRNEAIDELQTVYDEGRRDKTLLINLGTYLLADDRLDAASALLDECEQLIDQSPGLTDNKGLYLLKTGALVEAHQLYEELLSRDDIRFPEAYVHAAKVMIALGKMRKARTYLQQSLEREFFRTSTVSRDEVEQLLEELEKRPDSKDDVDDDDVDDELVSTLYENDLFDDSLPNTEVDEDDDLEPNIELDAEDYDDNDPEVNIEADEEPSVESALFDDDFDDGDEEHKK